MSSNSIIKAYVTFGFTYGVGRTIYYYDKLNDFTYTEEGLKRHPMTIPMFTTMSLLQGGMSATFWPLFMGVDISDYQKYKWGIRDSNPPYPFNSFEWRDKK
jgi:hypothetical protein